MALSIGTMEGDSGDSISSRLLISSLIPFSTSCLFVHSGGRSDGLVSLPTPLRTSIRPTPFTLAHRSPRPGVINRNGPPFPSANGSPSSSYTNKPKSLACGRVNVAAYPVRRMKRHMVGIDLQRRDVQQALHCDRRPRILGIFRLTSSIWCSLAAAGSPSGPATPPAPRLHRSDDMGARSRLFGERLDHGGQRLIDWSGNPKARPWSTM